MEGNILSIQLFNVFPLLNHNVYIVYIHSTLCINCNNLDVHVY